MDLITQSSKAVDTEAMVRFGFGRNWKRYLKKLNPQRLLVAKESLRSMLNRVDLEGVTFLDIGAGSGIFSLVAHELGANVTSFDYDQDSVQCAQFLKERFNVTSNWNILQGSILDSKFILSLGMYDIVYSWGVLHHTGNLHLAIDNAVSLVKPQGQLFIAIYHDEGVRSKIWLLLKRVYNIGLLGRVVMIGFFLPFLLVIKFIRDCLLLRNPFKSYINYDKKRGMSFILDWIDWLGGLPFEVSKPEAIVEKLESNGFLLEKLVRAPGHGCNEFVFRRVH